MLPTWRSPLHQNAGTRKLQDTAIERDGPILHNQVLQAFRCDYSGVTEINKGQVVEEEGHDGVKFGVCVDEYHHPHIPNHCYRVDEQEEQEEWDL